MSHHKQLCEMYRVSLNGEYATICVDAGERLDVDRPERRTFQGEILIHSSFGSFCHTWTNCSVPFKQFLIGIGFESFMRKCLGESFESFDGEASFTEVKRAILTSRREGELTRESAQALWQDLHQVDDVAVTSEYNFYRALEDLCGDDSVLGQVHEYVIHSPSDQAQTFWTELWPVFKGMLESELENRETVTAAPAV